MEAHWQLIKKIMIAEEEFKEYGFEPMLCRIGIVYFNDNGFTAFADHEDKDLYHLRRESADLVDVATFRTMAEYQKITNEWWIKYWESLIDTYKIMIEVGEKRLKELKEEKEILENDGN